MDVVSLRLQFWEGLAADVGIVLVFGAFSLGFLQDDRAREPARERGGHRQGSGLR